MPKRGGVVLVGNPNQNGCVEGSERMYLGETTSLSPYYFITLTDFYGVVRCLHYKTTLYALNRLIELCVEASLR